MAKLAPIRKADQKRRCLYCGFSGMSVQISSDVTSFRCPSCGGDLYSRPPRTYLEMEGFVPASTPARPRGLARILARVLGLYSALVLRWRGKTQVPLATSPPSRPARVHAPRSRPRRSSMTDEGAN